MADQIFFRGMFGKYPVYTGSYWLNRDQPWGCGTILRTLSCTIDLTLSV